MALQANQNSGTMTFFRNHWYDIGIVASICLLIFLSSNFRNMSDYTLLMWLSLAALFLHQAEEYRIVGTFPGMINKVLFHSSCPERYPLNSNTALVINVGIGWTSYLLAAIAGEKCIWLGMATILVSFGNIVAHTFLFNFKGKTLYNAGLASCWLLFAPCVFIFIKIILGEHLAQPLDFFIGIPLGICINILGVLKPISWLSNKNTKFTFNNRQLLPRDRKITPNPKLW